MRALSWHHSSRVPALADASGQRVTVSVPLHCPMPLARSWRIISYLNRRRVLRLTGLTQHRWKQHTPTLSSMLHRTLGSARLAAHLGRTMCSAPVKRRSVAVVLSGCGVYDGSEITEVRALGECSRKRVLAACPSPGTAVRTYPVSTSNRRFPALLRTAAARRRCRRWSTFPHKARTTSATPRMRRSCMSWTT